MDKHELWQHIQKLEKINQRRKLKRFAYTVLFYAAVFCQIFWWQGTVSHENIWEVLLGSILISVPYVWFNATVFGQLYRLSKEEDYSLEYLRKRLKEKEQEDT